MSVIWFYMVLLGFTGVILAFTVFSLFHLFFYLFLLGSTRFDLTLPSFS